MTVDPYSISGLIRRSCAIKQGRFWASLVKATQNFVLFGAGCIVLGVLVQYLEGTHLPVLTIRMLLFVEHLILVVDTVLYLTVIAYSGVGLIKEIIK